MKACFRYMALLALLVAMMPGTSQGVAITGLFTTGVDGSGNALGDGAVDPHYTIVEAGNASAITVQSASIPGSWVANNATSRWIWENALGTPINVTRTFETTFDLTGLNHLGATVSGTWSTDNFGLDILINGVSTGNTAPDFLNLYAFTVNTGFVAGVNTLSFVVQDVGGISGFRVGSISGSAVPEPSTLLLLGTGLVGLVGYNRRKRRA